MCINQWRGIECSERTEAYTTVKLYTQIHSGTYTRSHTHAKRRIIQHDFWEHFGTNNFWTVDGAMRGVWCKVWCHDVCSITQETKNALYAIRSCCCCCCDDWRCYILSKNALFLSSPLFSLLIRFLCFSCACVTIQMPNESIFFW